MNWYLFCGEPNREYIPPTHRTRQTTHEEFKRLARYLDFYRLGGDMLVADSLYVQILRRITDLPFSKSFFEEVNPDINLFPKHLEPDDYVLAIVPRAGGMYVGIAYARADNSKFRTMVDTWIVEPEDSVITEPVRIRSLAEDILALNRRIEQAELHLSADSIGTDEGNSAAKFRELLDSYKEEKRNLLKDPVLDAQKVKGLIEKCTREQAELESEKAGVLVRLQIELDANDNEDERERLAKNKEAIEKRLEVCVEDLETLKALQKEVEASTTLF